MSHRSCLNRRSAFDNEVCPTCLSSDRTLLPLGKETHNAMVIDFATIARVMKELRLSAEAAVCWECRARIRSMSLFLAQVREAKNRLDRALTTESLSNLATSTKHGYDLTLMTQTEELHAVNKEELELKLEMDTIMIKKDPEEFKSKENTATDSEIINEVADNDCYDDHSYAQVETDKNSANIDGNKDIDDKTNDEINNIDDAEDLKVAPQNVKHKKKDKVLHGKKFVMADAPYTLKKMSKKELMEHRALLRKQEPYASSRHKCEMCFKTFQLSFTLETHRKNYHSEVGGAYECTVCKRRFAAERTRRNHERRHYLLYSCRRCVFRCAQLDSIKTHMRRYHGEGQAVTCPQCGDVFRSGLELKSHLKTHVPKRLCVCDYCGKEMSKWGLVNHMRKHLGQPRLSCDMCDFTCEGESNMYAHCYHRHKSRPPPKTENKYCVECDRHFASVVQMRRHFTSTKRHAEHAMRVACGTCTQKFRSEKAMRSHVNAFHVEKQCDECGLVFQSKYRYRKHYMSKHAVTVGYQCEVCHVTLKRKGRMAEHMRTHTGERPLVCGVCGDTFRQKSALYTHTKLKHRKQNEPP